MRPDAGRPPHRPASYDVAFICVLSIGIAARLLLIPIRATEEDFFITLRYAANLAHGLGLVYNPGARVLGTTAPLYAVLLAGAIRAGMNPILVSKVVGIAADAVTCIAVYRLGSAVGRSGAGLAAAVCVSVLPVNLLWATKGMESGMVAACVTAAWAAVAEDREILAWAALAIAILLRIDAAAMALFMLAASVALHRRAPWKGLATLLVLLAPWTLFATLYYGSPIPASIAAKVTVYGRFAHSRFPRLAEFVGIMLHRQDAVLALGFVFAMIAFIRYLVARSSRVRMSRGDIVLAAIGLWALTYYTIMALSPVFLFGWYFVAPSPLYSLVSMVGWSLALRFLLVRAGLRARIPDAVRIAAPICIAVLLVAVTLPRVTMDLRHTESVETGLRMPIGMWLRAHAAPGDTLMLEPIGYIGYYSGLPILDTVGLVSPEVMRYWKPDVMCPTHEMWRDRSPPWILLRAAELADMTRCEAHLSARERLPATYDLVRVWPPRQRPADSVDFYLFRRKH